MDTKKQILAAVIAAVALAAIGGAVHLLVKDKADSTNNTMRSSVTPPDAAPGWTKTGQDPKPDYSALDLPTKNATKQEAEDDPKQAELAEKDHNKTDAPTEIEEHDLVRFKFVEELADYCVKRFRPARNGKRPHTTASFRTLNMHFGRDLEGINVSGDDINSARSKALSLIFTPDMMSTVYNLYAGLFVQELKTAAINSDKVESDELGRDDVSDMFRLNSDVLKQAAAIFSAIAENKRILPLTAQYIQASRAVERANVRFQDTLTDPAKKAASTIEGDSLKNAISKRESIRSRIVSQVRNSCPDCNESEIFYIAMWSYRRTLGASGDMDRFSVAAKCLNDMAGLFSNTADELLQPEQ